MRILVAGGQGQVGSALEQLGQDNPLNLTALSSSELNITSAQSISTAFDRYRPSLLINAAAYTSVDKAETEPELAYLINDTAVCLLADACAQANIPLLHISTDYVFDGNKEGLYTEQDLVNPLAVYAKSKEAGERHLRERLQKHIILRTSWVFSERGGNFVKTIVHRAKDKERLRVVADQVGGPSSARAIALALIQIADVYQRDGGIEWGTYHFSQQPYLSWHGFACAIIANAKSRGLAKPSVQVEPIPSSAFLTPVKRPTNSRLDTTKLEICFGVAQSDWHEDMERVLAALA